MLKEVKQMKKIYAKPEIDLIDLEAKESVMTTPSAYKNGDYWMDATSRTGYYEDDILFSFE